MLACGSSSGSVSTGVTLSGTITELVPGPESAGAPIAGVEVCHLAVNNCASTDANGVYSVRVFRNSEIQLTHVKEGYGSVLIARRSGNDDFVGDVEMATDANLADYFEAIGSPYPPVGSGYLTMTAFEGAFADGVTLAGVRYALTGSRGTSFYLDDEGIPDTSLTQTQTPGSGGFVEVAQVTVTVSITGAANCVSETSWDATANNSFRLPVRIGFWTQSEVSCE